ncbi:class I SAM-dependent methyltransferase [Nereida sp. MMG025]|uniref:class I SAM-dependent methyltransferase n=1 Tax=Nereida sp. MMG025 TaxID=2909981 RepID=UPI001F00DD27|nr:methyltransferase [Nereida sp. MMG025]MCF6445823.1 methyltransferase [Nereida sp. MMG025]
MPLSRLTLAINAGHVTLPDDGVIAVVGPPADADLSALPMERLQIVQGFKPDHDAWASRGYAVTTEMPAQVAGAIVFLPRAKDAMRARVAAALGASDGPITIDGLKIEGIDSLYKDLRKRGTVSAAFSKAHGKTFTLDQDADLASWAAPATPVEVIAGFRTLPGVFSAQGIDKGSAVLAEALPAKLPSRVADLGSGWGWLSAQILSHDTVQHLEMVEADYDAHRCAHINVTDPRAHLHWADATQFRPEKLCDAVIMNPPFHTSRNADPSIGRAFLHAGTKMLHQGGQMWIVANRHLPYENTLSELFLDVTEIAGTNSFKVLHARKPRRTR